MNANCERNDERLLALLLGELDDDAKREVEGHVAGCERCRAELESLRSTVDRLHQRFESEGGEPRLSAARVAELKAGNVERVSTPKSGRSFNAAKWGLMAAVGLFGLVGVTVLVNEGSSPYEVSEEQTSAEMKLNKSAPPAPDAPGDTAATAVRMDGMANEAAGEEAFRGETAEAREANTGVRTDTARRRQEMTSPRSAAPSAAQARPSLAPSADLSREAEQPVGQLADAPTGSLSRRDAIEPVRPGSGFAPPPAPRRSPPNDAEFDAMYFQNYGVNPFIDVKEDARSTFGLDVDTASYTIVRNYLNRGALPPPEAVRVEEFVNYFEADYPAPRSGAFAVYSEMTPSPFREGYSLLRIGIKGREVPAAERKPVVLTFVVDVSGSMAREDRLGLVKRTLATLLRELRPGDRVGLAVYGSRGEEILSHHDVTEEGVIERGIERLEPGGSTNAEEGLRIGYAMARRAFDPEAVNRVILCTDGVANVGRTGAGSILEVIGREAEDRIYLTTLGFGLGNYNDVLLEQLADRGNGHYAYLDSDEEALSFIRRRLAGAMEVIAQDVKIQVEFDPAAVRKYRLLGYENRDIADRDFRNDRVDAGEVHAGHSVTALYELKMEEEGETGDPGVVRLRFKDPGAGLAVREIEGRLDRQPFRGSFREAGAHFRLVWIAAQFAEVLRRSYWARDVRLEELIALLDASGLPKANAEAEELRELMIRAARLMPEERPEPVPMQGVAEDDAVHGTETPTGRDDEVRMLERPDLP